MSLIAPNDHFLVPSAARRRKKSPVAKLMTFARTAGAAGRGGEHCLMTVYGYARVSTDVQELDIQVVQLQAAGCTKLYCEKESGTKDDRRQLRKMLRHLKPGDVVIITAFDRLTRGGPFKTLRLLNDITSRGATYKFLTAPWANNNDEFAEVYAALEGYVARKTREDILRRTAAGRHRAMAAGVRFGRKPKLSAVQRVEAIARREAGEARSAIARAYNVSNATISRLRRDASVGGEPA